MSSLLEVKNLVKSYAAPNAGTSITSLKGVSFAVGRGESLGIIGQSGAGKTTLARCILGIEKPDSGEIHFQGKPIPEPGNSEWGGLRQSMQIIWQDPFAYLNPYMQVKEIVREPLENYRRGTRRDQASRTRELLQMVGIDADLGERYPHQLSGGQCQRVAIARALSLRPELLICDEPLAALDSLLQVQIISLLERLKSRQGLTYLFISHDLAAVRSLCSHVAVFHQGEIVEMGAVRDVFAKAVHPYSRLLLSNMLPLNQPFCSADRGDACCREADVC
jgi:ABC-type glutathione transport system ATPase component